MNILPRLFQNERYLSDIIGFCSNLVPTYVGLVFLCPQGMWNDFINIYVYVASTNDDDDLLTDLQVRRSKGSEVKEGHRGQVGQQGQRGQGGQEGQDLNLICISTIY